jgi:hypothetical protein
VPSTHIPSLRPLLVWGACLFGLSAAGCSDGVGTRYPVEGQVLLKGTPLRGMAGRVMFVPDRAKGNTAPVNPIGAIDAEGRYTVASKGKPGAPAGWYKVVVNPLPPGAGDREDVKRPAIHARFTTEKTTPLQIEVVAAPGAGAYDLKTTRN